MYFSVIAPRPGQERAAAHQRLNDDAYGDHQWLWRLFPAPPGTPRDFLFRRQELESLPRYHVVSERAPEEIGGAWQVQSRRYAPRLAAGDQLAFELRACPTVRHDRDGKSRRHDVVMEAKKKLLAERGLSNWKEWTGDDKPPLYALVQSACVAWLAKRGERAGFDLEPESCVASAYQQFGRRTGDGREASLQFSSVDLAGQLTVRDPVAFQQTLFRGLGSAKAFGCGLLLVRRLG
ncbi:MAG: hypothetical protein RLZ81_245 [Pseudomonadota bacterium]|jgi:CRISPR system Cascade subunit CasE